MTKQIRRTIKLQSFSNFHPLFAYKELFLRYVLSYLVETEINLSLNQKNAQKLMENEGLINLISFDHSFFSHKCVGIKVNCIVIFFSRVTLNFRKVPNAMVELKKSYKY